METASDREGMTRSQLLAARRSESVDQLQSSYDVWANKNPMWAPRATGPDAAAALGYGSGGEAAGPSTRRELMLERQMDNLRQSVAASGFDKDTQAALCANEPGVLVTSLVREAGQQNPSTAWVHNPKRATRTHLAKARADVDRGTIQHYQDRYEKYGHMGSQARSDFRVDQTIARMLDAGGGDTRSQLMERRKQQRMDDVEIAAEKVGFMPVPQFAEQETPFWRVGRPQTADAASPRGAKSREQMMSDRRWYAKPEHYPVVNPDGPRGDDDFKLAPDDKRYLQRKLANGPRKHQRGYPGKGGADGHPTASPVEDSALAEKLTIAPAPPIPRPEVPKHGNRAASAAPGGRRPQHPRFSDTVFRFLPPEERADHDQGPKSDGYRFTQPLYSSFSKSGVFEYTPPAPLKGATGGVRGAATMAGGMGGGMGGRPATVGGTRGGRGDPRFAYSAPAGITGGGLGRDMDRPKSAALSKEAMRMTSLLGNSGGGRGRPPAYGVRSGGFQLAEVKASPTRSFRE